MYFFLSDLYLLSQIAGNNTILAEFDTIKDFGGKASK